MTLRNLTNADYGIIVYTDGALAVVNWENTDENTMPFFLCPGHLPLWLECTADFFDVEREYTLENVLEVLDPTLQHEIFFDYNGTIQTFINDAENGKMYGGKVWIFANGMRIITWNE